MNNNNNNNNDDHVFVINPVNISNNIASNRYSNEEPIRLPTDVCIPISGNISDISLASSEERFRESELTRLPKARVATISSNPVARSLNEPLIQTTNEARRVFRPIFLTTSSPLRKRQAYGTFIFSLCFLLFIMLWIFIPRYPLPKFSNQELFLDNANGVLILKQTYSLYNNNFYNLMITNWNMNMSITSQSNPMTTITFQYQQNDNEILIPAKTSKLSYELIFNNYTSNEVNYEQFVQHCNKSVLASYYSVILDFDGKFYPTFQYTQEESTTSTPYDQSFSCIT
jgi:hypothetical protein